MKKKILLLLFLIFAVTRISFSRGDKTIPQVADGPEVRTKFTFLNSSEVENIINAKLQFFRQNGSPWVLRTSLGEGSEFTLNILPLETLRVETLGQSPTATSGYAVVRDLESENSTFSNDYHIGVTVFYEIFSGANLVDTVSVPIGKPTVNWVFPYEVDKARNLYGGLAIVNLSNEPNRVTLYLLASSSPVTSAAFTLGPGEQRAEFLIEKLFPLNPIFKGMVWGNVQKPVAVLALLQSPAALGVQYATLAPTYRDALRRNSYLYLPGPAKTGVVVPLDLDGPYSDYFTNADPEEKISWDLGYEVKSPTSRQLVPQAGAGLYSFGPKTDQEFDKISLADLRALSYQTDVIELGANPQETHRTFVFAVRTGLGQYAKVRIANIIQTAGESGAIYYDLALEVYIFH